MLVNQMINPQVTIQKPQREQTEVNRLLAAALISNQFCSLLLKDPARALKQGFAGEQFSLSNDEQDFILSLRASSLQEFVTHLCEHLSVRYTVAQPPLREEFNEGNRLM
jgi:hypothetical protein